jgi:hypothetical protein
MLSGSIPDWRTKIVTGEPSFIGSLVPFIVSFTNHFERISMNRIWILGEADPEMDSIESFLRGAGEDVAYAMKVGARVHSRNAYEASGLTNLDEYEEIVCVECSIDAFDGEGRVVLIDHHRTGDAGYGKGPDLFLEASSLGQVLLHIAPSEAHFEQNPDGGEWLRGYETEAETSLSGEEIEFVNELVPDATLIAAADHCLAAACNGECPGVDPKALMPL